MRHQDDVEAAIKTYARDRQRPAKQERFRTYRDRNKQPVKIAWTPPPAPPPPAPEPIRPGWRTALDARISRCPGCDDWQWDQACSRCVTTERSTAA